MDSGPCSYSLQRWHYDSTVGYCRPFHYGGCEGNRNRFQTNELCREECVSGSNEVVEPEPEPEVNGDFGEI